MDKVAHYFRCDLQVHSPCDQNWKGQDAVTPEERLGYAQSLVNACREKGLDAIAITDHHEMENIFYMFVSLLRRRQMKTAILYPRTKSWSSYQE